MQCNRWEIVEISMDPTHPKITKRCSIKYILCVLLLCGIYGSLPIKKKLTIKFSNVFFDMKVKIQTIQVQIPL